MMAGVIFIMSQMITLTGPEGQEIAVSPSQVVTVRKPRELEGHFPKGVQCLVHMTDGKFIAVIEPCRVVRELLEGEPD